MNIPFTFDVVVNPSVRFVRPTQPVEIFGDVLRHLGSKILRRSPQGNPSVEGGGGGGLTREV